MSRAVSTSPSLSEIVDTARYPIGDPTAAGWGPLVRRVRADLADVGCSVLPDFVPPTARDRAAREGDDVAAQAYTASAAFRRFLAACFDVAALYELADPLSGLCLNVVDPAREHPWHFDTNEYTVSMLTRQPDAGGEFEYCPNIRSPRDERLDAVRDVLAGVTSGRRLTLRPGDLQLFRGRYSLHRVTPVRGRTARHSAIFAYSERPGVVGTAVRARQLFGRVHPQHLTDATRVDNLPA